MTNANDIGAEINGHFVHWTKMTEAEETEWRELRDANRPARTRKTAKRRAGNSGSTTRTFNASSVLGRCLLAQIDRKNNPDEIPIDGTAGHYPQTVATDEYGVA